jgi:uncharacterized protein YjbJ (UPF0337 family)
VKKLIGLVALVFISGIAASRLMGSMGYGVPERVKGRAEQLKGRAEQAVGKVTGSEGTQARGKVDEATGRAREKIAESKYTARAAIDEVAAA